MGILGVVSRRVLALLRRRRLDAELEEEIRTHLDMRRDRLIADGMDPREAQWEARKMFGNPRAIRERSRDVWRLAGIESLAQDVRYAVRLLSRSPGFALLAIASLVIGIGATATVFCLADAVLVRTLPVRAPGELHAFRATIGLGGAEKRLPGVNDELFEAMRKAATPPVAAYRTAADITIAAERIASRSVTAEFVSGNYFDLLGVTTAAGAVLRDADDRTDRLRVVLSERLWKTAFNGSPAVIGMPVRVNGEAAVITGVTRKFRGIVAEHPADLFVPMGSVSLVPGLSHTVASVVARLDPATSAAAAERLKAIFVFRNQSMLRGEDVRVRLVPAGRGVSDIRDALRPPLRIGLLLAAVLLVVACANTGGLLLARFAARHGEFGVRVALGAGPGRIARQLLVEALIMATSAAVVALMVATVAAPALLRSAPIGQLPPDFDLHLDWRLVLFTAAIAVAASVASAGMCLGRLRLASASALLASNSRTIVRGRRTLLDRLTALQVACAVVLIATTGAMTRTMNNLLDVDPGFDAVGTLSVAVDASARRLEAARQDEYFSRLTDRVAGVEGVVGVTVVQVGLMSGAATTGTVDVPGFVAQTEDDRWVRMFFVGPGFFEVTGMQVVTGEALPPRRRTTGDRIAVVNEQFARFYFGEIERAVGRTANDGVRIVGVVADGHYDSPRDVPPRAMFVPFTQVGSRSHMTLVVRPRPGAQVAASVTAAIRDFDPEARVTVASADERLAATLARERFVAFLVAALSLFGIVLASAGLYGAVAFAIEERRQELAVRLALGATHRDILSLILRGPLRATFAGVASGLPVAWMTMWLIGALLFGVPRFDAVGLGTAAALVVILTLAAMVLPGRRALDIDAQECLRCQ